MRRPASVKENSGFCRVFLPPSLPTSGRRVPPLFAMFFLLRRVLEKPVPCVRFLVKRHVPAFGRSSALRFPPLAPLPSALWMGRIRPGASWGPSFPSRCCYLGDGLEDQDADRSHPDAAVGGELRRQTESVPLLVPPKHLPVRPAVSHPQWPSGYAAALAAAWLLRSGSYTSPVTSNRCSRSTRRRVARTREWSQPCSPATTTRRAASHPYSNRRSNG